MPLDDQFKKYWEHIANNCFNCTVSDFLKQNNIPKSTYYELNSNQTYNKIFSTIKFNYQIFENIFIKNQNNYEKHGKQKVDYFLKELKKIINEYFNNFNNEISKKIEDEFI